MRRAAFAAVLLAATAFAAGGAAKGGDKTSVQLAEYFLKVPLADADPKFVEPFLAVDAASLPKKLRGPAAAKQLEIRTLLRLHDTKKLGGVLPPAEGCTPKDFTYPPEKLSQFRMFKMPLEEIDEDEERKLEERTRCTETDLGCRFSLMVFADPNPDPKKRKPRRLTLLGGDPLMATLAQLRQKTSSGTAFFGGGQTIVTCEH